MDLNAPVPNEAGVDAGDGVDLTPRRSRPARRGRRRWLPVTVLAVVLVAGAVVLFQGLSNATVYFCNADEIGQRSECDPDQRFRLQGTVDPEPAKEGDLLRFTVSYGEATVPVEYRGDPGGIFRVGIPVVVEGRLRDDGVFAGDRILVRHTEQYREENPDRVEDYGS